MAIYDSSPESQQSVLLANELPNTMPVRQPKVPRPSTYHFILLATKKHVGAGPVSLHLGRGIIPVSFESKL